MANTSAIPTETDLAFQAMTEDEWGTLYMACLIRREECQDLGNFHQAEEYRKLANKCKLRADFAAMGFVGKISEAQ